MMYANRVSKRKNGLPIGFSYTVTVFNRVIRCDDSGKTYSDMQPTVINNCFYGKTKSRNFNQNAQLNVCSVVCKIPPDARYLPPEQFEKLSAEQQSAYFTLRPDDMIFQGEHNAPDVESNKGRFFIIKQARDLTPGGILPHYRAEGV